MEPGKQSLSSLKKKKKKALCSFLPSWALSPLPLTLLYFLSSQSPNSFEVHPPVWGVHHSYFHLFPHWRRWEGFRSWNLSKEGMEESIMVLWASSWISEDQYEFMYWKHDSTTNISPISYIKTMSVSFLASSSFKKLFFHSQVTRREWRYEGMRKIFPA